MEKNITVRICNKKRFEIFGLMAGLCKYGPKYKLFNGTYLTIITHDRKLNEPVFNDSII